MLCARWELQPHVTREHVASLLAPAQLLYVWMAKVTVFFPEVYQQLIVFLICDTGLIIRRNTNVRFWLAGLDVRATTKKRQIGKKRLKSSVLLCYATFRSPR